MMKPKPWRVAALDVARGLFLIASVTTSSVLAPRPDYLLHRPWFGTNWYDMIFPLFVTLSGIGLAFANHKGPRWLPNLRRMVVLASVGVIYEALAAGNWGIHTFRATGVLQLYAVLVILSALLHVKFRSARAWAAITVVSASALTAYLAYYGSSCPLGALSPRCNPSGVLDVALFGSHAYAQGVLGYDPEGVISILGAFVTASAGTTTGHLVLQARRVGNTPALRKILYWVAFVAAFGMFLSLFVPAFKKLWTPSFGLVAASVGIALFVISFVLFDILGRAKPQFSSVTDKVAWPFVAVGRQSLLVYFGSHLAVDILSRVGSPVDVAHTIRDFLSFTGHGQITFTLLMLAFWWILAAVLHRHKIYVHA